MECLSACCMVSFASLLLLKVIPASHRTMVRSLVTRSSPIFLGIMQSIPTVHADGVYPET